MKGNVHAQIYLARKFEKFQQTRAEIVAELDKLTSKLVDNPDRHLTSAEARWIEQARVLLDEIPRPEGQTFIPAKKPRSRRKPKSDPGEGSPGDEA